MENLNLSSRFRDRGSGDGNKNLRCEEREPRGRGRGLRRGLYIMPLIGRSIASAREKRIEGGWWKRRWLDI